MFLSHGIPRIDKSLQGQLQSEKPQKEKTKVKLSTTQTAFLPLVRKSILLSQKQGLCPVFTGDIVMFFLDLSENCIGPLHSSTVQHVKVSTYV